MFVLEALQPFSDHIITLARTIVWSSGAYSCLISDWENDLIYLPSQAD